MNISRLLGATMVAGALATGGAAAGIAGASAASTTSTSETGTKTSQSTTTTPSTTTTTTPSKGSSEQPTAPKSGATGKHPCPNMGSHQSGSAAQGPPTSGAGYPAAPAGATAQ